MAGTQRSPGPKNRGPAAGNPQSSAPTSYTSTGPTWYLKARPLSTCHADHADEYAIDCPGGGDHEALAWRARPGVRHGGWACPMGHRGQLWQLLPGAA